MQNPPAADRPPEAAAALSDSDHLRWFAEEVTPHEPVLRAYLRGAFPAVRDLDDVVQESLLRVWRAQQAGRVYLAKAFLFTVARRLALDWVRHERRSPVELAGNPADLDVIDEREAAADVAGAKERIEILSDALICLPPRCRMVVMLYRLKNLSRSEVARRLEISEKTVDEQVARGVKRLARHFRARKVDRLFES